jgi:hypothetical protein
MTGDRALDKAIPYDPKLGARIVVACEGTIACTAVDGELTGTDAKLSKSAATKTGVTFVLPKNNATNPVTVVLKIGSDALEPPLLFAPQKDSGGTSAATPAQLALSVCPARRFATSADIVLDGRGNVLATSDRTLNEGDKVTVVLYADTRLLDQLRVSRSSPTRVEVVSRILGEGTTATDLKREAQEEQAPIKCDLRTYTLSDFAPGTGKLDVTALGTTPPTTMYSYEFKVNTLYTGMLSFGPMWSTVADYTFSKTFNGTDTVVTSSPDTARRRLLYVVSYTPFVWGPRDVTVGPADLWHRINPFIGVALNDVTNNAFLGVSAELASRIAFTWAMHAGKVTRLDPTSGAVVGKPFANRAPTVPTVQKWSVKAAYGVTVDVLAAVQLLKAAVAPAH